VLTQPRPARQPAPRAPARLCDRRSSRDLQNEIYPQALRFALIMVDRSDVAIRIARRAMPSSKLSAGTSPRQEPAAHAWSADERLSRAVTELCDGQGLSHRVVARSLGTSPEEVARLHELARREAGVDPVAAPQCSGWSLVRRYDDLAAVELVAANRHIELCRDCSDAQLPGCSRVRGCARRSPSAAAASSPAAWPA